MSSIFIQSFLVLTALLVSGCTKSKPVTSALTPAPTPVVLVQEDPYLFLEQREGQEALDWVKPRSDKTVAALSGHAKFEEIKANVTAIRNATDRLASPAIRGKYIYNFWTDEKHKKGVWRRTSVSDYDSGKPVWEDLLDIATLAKAEGKNWVFKGTDCLKPAYRYCLVHLSDGGEDATIVREYDTEKKEFRKDGFVLPEAKHTIAWWSEDELLLATDFGPGSLTNSEYPRTVRRWKRGTSYLDATLIFEGKKEDVSVAVFTEIRDEGTLAVMARAPSFFEQEYSVLSDKGLESVPLPKDAEALGVIGNEMLVRLRKDWTLGARKLDGGSLISLPLGTTDLAKWEKEAKTVYNPDARSTFESITTTKTQVFLTTINEVKGRMESATLVDGKWVLTPVDLPKDGVLSVLSADSDNEKLYVEYQSFLSPSTYYRGELVGGKMKWTKTAQLAERFDSSDLVSEQRFATSKDGTSIPYFVVRKKDMKFDGSNPTLLYGYGGFEVSLLPKYSPETGKNWLEKGGVYVIANIRGGGEFGPKWHEAAILQNRQKAYDDFIAVAENLIDLKITSSRRLGIRGGSNGGLLVGAVTMQRPDLFNAVICSVPLLDMVRYQKLPPGDSWSGEYGSANDPVVGPAIWKYSPYQNIHKDKKYPKIYFWSSSKDDRVHPAHARKMVARMQEYGHDVLYYESSAGGHGGSGDTDQAIKDESMAMAYLYAQLVD